jgi:hypothetical protein
MSGAPQACRGQTAAPRLVVAARLAPALIPLCLAGCVAEPPPDWLAALRYLLDRRFTLDYRAHCLAANVAGQAGQRDGRPLLRPCRRAEVEHRPNSLLLSRHREPRHLLPVA